jgi:hypothetical protein
MLCRVKSGNPADEQTPEEVEVFSSENLT